MSNNTKWPPELDAVVAAPKHHSILLENEHVRVLDTRIDPADITPLHTHRWPSVLHILSMADFVRRDGDGKVLIDTRLKRIGPMPKAIWSVPLPPHTLANVGDVPIHVLAVEIKDRHSGNLPRGMDISLTRITVTDPRKALDFYTNTLGFAKGSDPSIEETDCVIVFSPGEPSAGTVLLVPVGDPSSAARQKALFEQGVPLAVFAVDDIQEEYSRLRSLGVLFKTPPTRAGTRMIAVFDDTYGNWIQLYQEAVRPALPQS